MANTAANHIDKIPSDVTRRLRYYVYVYVDPDSGDILYVGKGKGQRALTHIWRKFERRDGKIVRNPRIDILIHGLDNETAHRVEAAAIETLGLENLANKIGGWRSRRDGRQPLTELEARYGAKRARITHPVILIKISRQYFPEMPKRELYEATRYAWTVGERREQAEFACAVADNVVREIYAIDHWYAATGADAGRWAFVGKVADGVVRAKYVGRHVHEHFPPKAQNPITYVNC